MARLPDCDLCKDEPAVLMWSDLRDGTTLAVGEICAPGFVVGIAAALGYVALPVESVPVELGGTLAPDPPDEAPKKGKRRPSGASVSDAVADANQAGMSDLEPPVAAEQTEPTEALATS